MVGTAVGSPTPVRARHPCSAVTGLAQSGEVTEHGSEADGALQWPEAQQQPGTWQELATGAISQQPEAGMALQQKGISQQ